MGGGDRLSAAVQRFVTDLDLSYQGQVVWPTHPLPLGLSVHLDQVVRTRGEPIIEIGNSGHRHALSSADLKPGRRGYAAIAHHLDLPQVWVDARTIGPKSAANLAQASLAVGRHLWDMVPSEGEPSGHFDSPAWVFRSTGTRLELPGRRAYSVWCRAEDAERAQALLTAEALDLIGWLTQWFDLEIHQNWLLAHCNHGDLATADDQTWQWALSVVSACADLLAGWGDPTATHWAHHTSVRAERPDRPRGRSDRRKGR